MLKLWLISAPSRFVLTSLTPLSTFALHHRWSCAVFLWVSCSWLASQIDLISDKRQITAGFTTIFHPFRLHTIDGSCISLLSCTLLSPHQIRYRKDKVQSKLTPTFPLVSAVKDLSNGCAIAAVLHYYCPSLLPLEGTHVLTRMHSL